VGKRASKNAKVLCPKRVMDIYTECTVIEAEDVQNPIVVSGIRGRDAFHPERVEHHRQEISAMLDALPERFHGPGGLQHHYGCMDRSGNLWTGLQGSVEQLFLLGMAIGRVTFPIEQQYWSELPGGMPVVMISPAPTV